MNLNSSAVIDINAVSKSFGATRAVDSLSLRVDAAETVALLGPNGAGKTTTISMLLGLQSPDSGSIRVLGGDPADATRSGLVGAMLQDGGLMPGVRVAELLQVLASLYAAPLPVGEAIALAQLTGLETRRVDRLSGGQAQRLRVALALIGNPRLLVLDEPTAAMDVEARRNFWGAMRNQATAGRTILFSTHYLEEADAFADRVVVISHGTVLADGTPASIKGSIGSRVIRVTTSRAHDDRLHALPGVASVSVHGERAEIQSTDSDATIRALLAAFPDAHDIEVTGLGLEDAFINLTATRAA